jgi:hypothetical protein
MKTIKTIPFALMLFLGSCKDIKKEKKMEEENFSWSACVTSPSGYFAEVASGYLATDKEPIASFVDTGDTQGYDWYSESDGITGSDKIPTHFSLTWLSFADKKFWKAEGKLPADRIRVLFKEGYMHTDMVKVRSKITYKKLIFGLAPGGHVVVWLGGKDQRVELASFQATEDKEANISEFWRNPDYLSPEKQYDLFYGYLKPETQAYIKAHGLPIGKWEKYRKRYNYRFVSKHYKLTVKERFDRQIKYYNGEEEILKEGELDIYLSRAIPYNIGFFYLDNELEWAEATFDDQEIMEVFEILSKKYPNEPMDIIANVGFEYRNITFTVVCGKDRIPLKKITLGNMSGIMK